MKASVRSNWRVIRVVAIITLVVSIGYSFFYGFNPLIELIYLPRSYFMSQNMTKRVAPEIRGIDHWLNTPDGQALTLAGLRGRVVMVDFWTYSCINCQRDIPHINALYDKYKDQGFMIIGVHTPEFAFEQKLENVRTAVSQYSIAYPVAMDNDYKTWRAYGNLYWPARYLIDKEGNIVYKHYGEGAYQETDFKIRELLE